MIPSEQDYRVYVCNRAILQAHYEQYGLPGENPRFAYLDFTFQITRTSKARSYTEETPAKPNYLGENAEYYYTVSTPASQNPDCSEMLLWRNTLIHHIGEDAYFDIVGDLVVTPDMVRDMITIHDAVEPAE